MKNIVIVGAGLGGIATALRLAKKGYKVQLLEKNNQAGGRLNQIKKEGFTFDTGPSFFSMSYEFTEFARDCNIELPFKYYPLDPLYSVNFSDNPNTFHLYRDLDKLASQFSTLEPDFRKKTEKYLKKSGALFHDTVDKVIKNNFDSKLDFILTLMQVNPIHLPVLGRTFWQQVGRHFTSKEAKQIISLVAFFLGRTPFDTMGIYTLLSYTEFQHDGYFNVEGGMYKIVEGFVDELKKENVEIHYNTEIVDFKSENNKITGFVDNHGKQWVADAYLVNSDAAYFRNKVLRREKYSGQKMEKLSWTMGYLTFYVGVKCKLPQVNHHNYYLGSNYEEYSNNILREPGTLEKPYYYVNVLSKSNPGCAPEGCESLFFVCPVPNLLYKTDWSDAEKIANSIMDDFSARIGKNIESEIVTKTIYTPVDWQNQFNLYKGSGLGLSHSLGQIGAFRPTNFDEKFKNLFYVGASTLPGAGIPMAVISSKLAFKRLDKYLSSKN